MTASNEDVPLFLGKLEDKTGIDADDECYNVTPPEIKEKYGFEIFKFDKSYKSFLMYNDKIYTLGESFGGMGAVSFAVADINGDNAAELYYTYSWGSGQHRSHIGYFDSATEKITDINYTNWNTDLVFGINEYDGGLAFYAASVKNSDNFDIEFELEELRGMIVCESGEIIPIFCMT